MAAKMIKKDRIAKDKERLYFINELHVSRMLDYEYIVKTHEIYEVEGYFIIVQDFIDGINLLQYIKVKKKLAEKVSIHVIYQLFLSINYLHQKGYVHRDIKPQNIMLRLNKITDRSMVDKVVDFKDKYSIILIDFGLCADYHDHTPSSFLHDKSGTTGYLAPEVIKSSGGFYNERVDTFSAGMVLVEM